ncbi:MAG: zinc-ribbon domain-containing protein [Candidatus Limnocylindria bacterium]
MDHNERDRRDPPDAEDAGPSSAESAPVADEGTAEPIDSSATAEIESWPSQDASASSASAAATPETAAWSTEPPAAGSAAAGDWPTDPPERGDEPILAPDWPTASDREAHDDAPPPSEVEAYPAPSMAPRDADPDAGGAADGSVAATAAHAVPAGEGAVGESTQCPRCGTENRPGLAFCRNCGQRLVAAGVASAVERPGTPEGTMACPRCGTHNRAGVAFCQNCGANLRGTAPGYVPPAVAADAGVEADQVERRGAILGPVVLLIGLVGIITGYLLPFLYGSGSLYERAMGPDGYGFAFWSGYPDVTGGLADQAYFGLAGPIPILGALLLILAIAGFMRAVPGPLQTIGLGIALLWSVGLIVLFVVVELAANWSGDLVGMLRVLTPAGIIFLLSSLIVLIGTLTRFGRS